ncbi:hypothetical protein [Methylobacterium gnaphalii]|uniref:Uncharacterized protein n=1 Tax=Methylobacterium gnaphalii TaxID=1010610 RepID=A0A512JGG7_9HYPH|nr:hypothetical protein [Methylobacterium gnaphalii]GEP09033.1 hypothetical protein MGN01_08780 [Methylobacterium gnaphalii]GJD68343.1 hypothetical protein MMMDOFMJ_1266 [Methylobacterium gnaphalii]
MRLIRKERGASRIVEGYFTPKGERISFVRVAGPECHLFLVVRGVDGHSDEELTAVPPTHGNALLDVCAGKITFERTVVPLGGRDVAIDRFVTPPGLDTASLIFADSDSAQTFVPPVWFGREVTGEAGFEPAAVAIGGVPAGGELTLNNAALDAVLDLLEPRFGLGALRRAVGEPG